jgi:hypothetical protein
MPIQVEHVEGELRPIVVCDHCKKTIREVSDGHVVWNRDLSDSTLEYRPNVFFYHSRCDHEIGQKEKRASSWRPLETFLVHLVNNLEIDWDTANERASFLS